MTQSNDARIASRRSQRRMLVLVATLLVAASAVGLVVSLCFDVLFWEIFCAVALSISSILLGRFSKSDDKVRADQTNRMLRLAGDTLHFMKNGLDSVSAQRACEMLLPLTDAYAVAIIDKNGLLAHCGCPEIWELGEEPSVIPNLLSRFDYGAEFVVAKRNTPERLLKGCIASPLKVQDNIVGVLKFYYPRTSDIDETQQAVVVGFSVLLSNQLALAELDAKTELATKMELRALQAQINPHFLFNTINTIASLIRTDPRQARVLLREFAIFYRRTLESSQDLITIELELTQTLRYLGFERARFGSERIWLVSYVEPGLDNLQVPAFIIQPIVENAVGHAMRPDGEPLHIDIKVERRGDNVVISVADDGVGMESTETATAVKKGNSPGAGIALKNVDDRLRSCFGAGSGITIESELGVGTTVYLTLANAATEIEESAAAND